ncbi:MAG: lytic transglycosylase domain-containing protein [Clostridium sp.]|nr:lytic transglycosylase domain-containing protein [Clostridium sp.]
MNISSVEQYIGYTVASQIMKKGLGNGMEYELIFQSMLEKMQNNNKSSETSGEFENKVVSTNSSVSLDSLPLIRVGDQIPVYNNQSLTYNLSDLSSLGIINTTEASDISESYSYINSESIEMSEIYDKVNKYATMHGVDPALVLAVIKAESNFDANAISGAGAIGLMQVMNFNLESLGINNGYNIDENIRAGVTILKNYLDYCDGDISMALMAYNAGPGTMLNRGVTSAYEIYKMPLETQNYVPKVLGYYNEFRN